MPVAVLFHGIGSHRSDPVRAVRWNMQGLMGTSVISSFLVFGVGSGLAIRSAILSAQPDWVGITGLIGVLGGLVLKWREADISRIKVTTAKQAVTIVEQAKAIALGIDERRRLELKLLEADTRLAEFSHKLAQTAATAERADATALLADAKVEQDRAASSGSHPVVTAKMLGPTILLVEDVPEAGEYMRLKLTKAHFHVETAGTYAEGLSALIEHEPDFLVLDLSIPGGRGEDLIRKVHELGLSTRVIVTTGKVGNDLNEVRSLSPYAILTKPFDFYSLLAALDHADS